MNNITEKDLDNFLEELYDKNLFFDNEWKEFLSEIYKIESREQLLKDLQTGVNNGYSLKDQLKICKKQLNVFK